MLGHRGLEVGAKVSAPKVQDLRALYDAACFERNGDTHYGDGKDAEEELFQALSWILAKVEAADELANAADRHNCEGPPFCGPTLGQALHAYRTGVPFVEEPCDPRAKLDPSWEGW